MAGPSHKKESAIRADTPVVFGRGSAPDAQAKLAIALQQPVATTRTYGAYMVADDELWGIFELAMSHVDLRALTVDFSPSRKGESKMWI